MRTPWLLALGLTQTLALRLAKLEHSSKPPSVAKCEVPEGFQRVVNSKAHRKPTEEEMSAPGFYGEPHLQKIYYINLEQSTDRKKRIEKQIEIGFPGVPYERWPASRKGEAVKIIKKNLTSFSAIGYGSYSGAGTQATYLSHYLLLQNISAEKDPNAVFIIAEDDIFLNRRGLMENVACQLKMLPPEWDIFKFGYWGFTMDISEGKKSKYQYPACPGQQINKFTCHQEHFNWNYMGNQAYAVRSKGAAILLEHLHNTPIMDVDGAMMPGINHWDHRKLKPVWPNTYVSKHNMVGHGGFKSMRALKNAVAEQSLDDVDGATDDFFVQDAKDMANGDDPGRETAGEEFERIQRGEHDVLSLSEDQFE